MQVFNAPNTEPVLLHKHVEPEYLEVGLGWGFGLGFRDLTPVSSSTVLPDLYRRYSKRLHAHATP